MPEFDIAKVGPAVAVAIIMVLVMMVGISYNVIHTSTNALEEATPGTYTTGSNTTNTETFEAQIPFGEPVCPAPVWYTFNNDPWSQSTVWMGDCDGGSRDQLYMEYWNNGNHAYGNYALTHTGSDYKMIDFHINTTSVDSDDAYFWEDFENNWPASEGNLTPDPYPDTYDYEETATSGMLNLSAGFNASYDPEIASNNTVWWINNTGVGDDAYQWFNESASTVAEIYEIGFDFNVTDFNEGIMWVTPGYPDDANTSFRFQTNPNGYDYVLWGNDTSFANKNLSEFPLTGPNVWYTVRFYFDNYNETINCTIWDTATTTELYQFGVLDHEPVTFGDLLIFLANDSEYGNVSIKIDNYYVMGYDSMYQSNAFKVVPIDGEILMIIDNVNETEFDVSLWNGTAGPIAVYSGLSTDTWYHYFMEFNWDNNTIETTVRNSNDNAWLGNGWIGMSGNDISGILFSGIDTFDCSNSVDNITTWYDDTVVHPGDDTASGVYENIKEQSGNALALALIIAIAIAAVVVILVILVLPRMLGRE